MDYRLFYIKKEVIKSHFTVTLNHPRTFRKQIISNSLLKILNKIINKLKFTHQIHIAFQFSTKSSQIYIHTIQNTPSFIFIHPSCKVFSQLSITSQLLQFFNPFLGAIMNDYHMLFKFILIGDSNVGKSCVLLRFLQGRFKNQHQPTLGVEFGAKIYKVKDKKVKLQIWDTAGQESFKSITRAYYKGSIGALLIFDLSEESSFLNLKQWLIQVKTHSHSKMKLIVLGNKADLKDKRQVSQQDINLFLKQNNIEHYFQISALNGDNVDKPFLTMAGEIVDAIQKGEIKPQEECLGVKLKANPYKKPFVKLNSPGNQIKLKQSECEC